MMCMFTHQLDVCSQRVKIEIGRKRFDQSPYSSVISRNTAYEIFLNIAFSELCIKSGRKLNFCPALNHQVTHA